MTDSSKLAAFIDEQNKRQDVDGGLRKLVCVQIVKGNRIGDEIRMISVPDDGADQDWIDETARKLVGAAQEEALTLGCGIQRYAVQAWFGKEERPRSRFVFTCAGADEDPDAIGTEGPDEAGIIAQTQRHQEITMQMATRSVLQQLADQRQEIASLRRENEQMRAERMRDLKIVRDLYLADAERASVERREAVKTRLIETSVERLETFIPHAVNAWARSKGGKDVFPEAAAQMVTAKKWVDSITDADLEKLKSVWGEQKAAELVMFATTISKLPDEAKQIAKPEERAGLNGSGSSAP